MVVLLMESSILSEVDDASILRAGLSTPLSPSSRLVTDPSAHAPAQRAEAQRLFALAHRFAYRDAALYPELEHS